MHGRHAQNHSFAVFLGGLISDSVLKIHCYLKQNPRRRKLIRRETVLGFSGGQGDPGSGGLKLHMCSRPAGRCLQIHWTVGATDCWGLHPPPGGKTFWSPLYNIFTPGASSTSAKLSHPQRPKGLLGLYGEDGGGIVASCTYSCLRARTGPRLGWWVRGQVVGWADGRDGWAGGR